MMAAEEGIETSKYREFAETQINYMLGSCNGQSYQIGFGDKFPQNPHHRSSSCPDKPASCSWNDYNSQQPNPQELTGALVGGPDTTDFFNDVRTDYKANEVTTDYNAGFQSVLAGLINMDVGGNPMTGRPNTEAPTTTVKPPPTQQPTTGKPGAGMFDYQDSLQKSMLFYFAQRSGSITDKLVPWRETSAMGDGSDNGRDLTGGWYDAGDHVKFGFPMAASATNLLWGFLQWPEGYQAGGKTNQMYKLIKHPLDYFLKCWDNGAQRFYGQVGDGNIDHSKWGRPEDMTEFRPSFYVDASKGGSDLVGETAAALAAGSLAFENKDSAYSAKLLTAAKQLYTFAEKYQKAYHESIPNAAGFYRSWSGYKDELCWGAAWLYKATGDSAYKTKAETYMGQMGNPGAEFSWDDKKIGCYTLMYSLTKDQSYKQKIQSFMNQWLNTIQKTPCGLVWHSQWGPLRYTANAALIGMMAADEGIETSKYREFAETQINYMLGSCNGQSFQIGFGDKFPQNPHHRSSSCPDKPASCSWNDYNSQQPNPQELTGALVGGPDTTDFFNDVRTDYKANEVTTDYNAGFQSVLAGLIKLDVNGQLR